MIYLNLDSIEINIVFLRIVERPKQRVYLSKRDPIKPTLAFFCFRSRRGFSGQLPNLFVFWKRSCCEFSDAANPTVRAPNPKV